ncbi:stage II sporulation protein SpoIIP [Bacillus sp. TH22]|jgi:stage II sporulation protein P|uniref:Stage II sporulation protein P n=3 Tax=Bacillus cereus group TaxID=86661 RepID=A0A109GEK7_BACMY|nr:MULTISPECIES: stage II sporulation protein SpoIIP [Bacillus]MBJ7993036.1 stage II sporulation protein SpoIIP [Bacillus cereus]MBK5358364.1 stage II sporulation protein SpoIIP [Bacillus sp. TH44]ARJ21734.1 stage II sporulation protein P [Bacillus mycoides]EJV87994.1 stage II sporulation protein P [Bacillus cereus HuA2-1]EOP42321.1 stage II sporulation protein P [Bacillus cereus VD146]
MNRGFFYVKLTSVRKLIIFIITTVLATFFLISVMVTSMKETKSTYLYNWLNELSMNGYMYVIGKENHYFTQEYRNLNQDFSISSFLFSMATNIRFDDVRSFVGKELPGFGKYDTEIVIAGEGTNYSNLPIESSVPLEEVVKERTGEAGQVPKPDPNKEKKQPAQTTGKRQVALIYHSHSWESYLPLLNLTNDPNPNKATSSVTNISIVGDRLREQLESEGIGATNDKTDVGQKLISKGLNSNSSYKLSREIVQEAMAGNKELQYFFDLHRDSARKNVTTKTIGDKSYAKLAFVIGKGNKNYEKNLQLATALHEEINKKYPGVSRGVIQKGFQTGNGVYNQDLSGQAILIEVGGVDNTEEELNRSIDVLAKAFGGYFWQAEKVNG